MAQFAAHMAAGIVCGRFFTFRYFRYGLLAGAILPDFDFIPMVLLYLFDPEIARMFHRSATHTLLLPAIFCILACLARLVKGRNNAAALLSGIATGIITHILLDVLFWFDKVNLLWPIEFGGQPLIADIWSGANVMVALKNFLGPSVEFLFYGLLFHWVRRYASGHTGFIARNIPQFERISFAMFALSIVPAFFLPEKRFAELAYGATSLFFAPLSLVILWQFRIELTGSDAAGDAASTGEPAADSLAADEVMQEA